MMLNPTRLRRLSQLFYAKRSSSYKKKSFRESWLSDPGAYPVMGLIVVATLLPVIYGVYTIATSPDARFFRQGRKEIFRGLMDYEIDDDSKEAGAPGSSRKEH